MKCGIITRFLPYILLEFYCRINVQKLFYMLLSLFFFIQLFLSPFVADQLAISRPFLDLSFPIKTTSTMGPRTTFVSGVASTGHPVKTYSRTGRQNFILISPHYFFLFKSPNIYICLILILKNSALREQLRREHVSDSFKGNVSH